MESLIVGARVLFFGRNKCEASQKIFRKLERYGFNVTYFESKNRNEPIPEDIFSWEGEYIICFRSLFILSEQLLRKAKVAAINFHPAPPEYPGSGCINFALYDEAENYGVTAHLMNKKVDNGKILEVRRFPINYDDDLPKLLKRTHTELYDLCSDFIHALATQGESILAEKENQSVHEVWYGKAHLQKELEKLQIINPKINKLELERIIRATNIEGFPPKITLHGYSFYLKLDD